MRSRINAGTSLFGIALLMCGAGTAQAQLSLTYDSDVKQAVAGQTVIFRATVTNTGTSSILINNGFGQFGADGNGPGMLNDDGFANNFSGQSVGGGQSITEELFHVVLDPGAAPGDYTGFYEVDGGPNPNSSPYQVTRNFRITVAAVPEIPVSIMMAGGLGLTLLGRRRQMARSSRTQG